MARFTSHLQLQALNYGDNLSKNSYAFVSANMDDIDSYLWRNFQHHHDGIVPSSNSPVSPPNLSLSTAGGSLPPGVTLRYVYSLVDSYGTETLASPEATVTTPSAIPNPNAPSLGQAATGGSLLGGSYFYAVSAYDTSNTNETLASPVAIITVGIATTTNVVTVVFPSLPSGATGYNIYRRGPGEAALAYLTSVDMSGATPPSTYRDTGGVAENTNRQPQNANVTRSTNSVVVTFPGATPVVPAGYTWRVYRTLIPNNYTSSLLANVVEQTFSGSGVIVTTVTDTGGSTMSAAPRSNSGVTLPAFSKIDLANMNEVQNSLPPGNLWVPHVVSLTAAGTFVTGLSQFVWTCDYTLAQVMGARAVLGNGTSPGSSQVIVDICKYIGGATPVWTSIYGSTTRRPTVGVGLQLGSFINTTSADTRLLAQGDRLRFNVIQTDAAAQYLTLNILMYTQAGSVSTSFVHD